MRNKLCRLLTSPDTSVSTMGAELLFVLCKEKGKTIFVNFIRAHVVSEYSLDLKRALSSFQVMRMYVTEGSQRGLSRCRYVKEGFSKVRLRKGCWDLRYQKQLS